MSMSILYVMLHVTFYHQQNHNVPVHGKVTVTTVSVQNIFALSLRNALILRKWLMRLRRPVVSSPRNEKTLQRPASVRPEQSLSPLQVAGNCIELVELPLPTSNYDSAV